MQDRSIDDDRTATYKSDSPLLQVHNAKDEIWDDHYMLLPPTVEAFVLERKQWMSLLVDEVEAIDTMQRLRFHNLLIPDGYEKILKALVDHHSSQKQTKYSPLRKCSGESLARLKFL